MVTRKIQQDFIFSHQYINRLILFIVEIVIYGNIYTVADKRQIFKFFPFLRKHVLNVLSPHINLGRSRGAFGKLY